MSFPTPAKEAKSIDWLFAQLPGQTPTGGPLIQALPEPATGGQAPPCPAPEQEPYAGPTLPPLIENPNDLRAAYDWLNAEKARLEEYTRAQFARIRQQHEALLNKHMQSEQTLAMRAQEVNREIAFLTTQADALRRRGQELAHREQVLAGQMDELAKAQAELLAIQETSQNVRRDTESQRALLETLQAETARLQAVEASARGQFETLESDLRARQRAWEEKQAEIMARQAVIEQRYLSVEKAEEAVRTRMKELDEYEDRLRRELEQQEQKLAQERHDFELMRTNLRLQKLRDERNRSAFLAGPPVRQRG